MANLNGGATTYVDYPIDATLDSQGQITQLIGLDAFLNALTSWIVSFKDEKIRDSGRGGFITGLLEKNISEDTANDLRSKLSTGLQQDFEPPVQVISITVTPNYKDELYEIAILGYVPSLKQTFEYYNALGQLSP